MKRILFFVLLFSLVNVNVQAQQKKKIKNRFPEKISTYIDFDKGQAYYTKDGLNKLDSLYMVAFNKDNKRFYKMTITGFDDGEEVTEQSSTLARDRAVMVFKYFSSREETEYIIKRTPSTSTSFCEGEKNIISNTRCHLISVGLT